MDRTLDHKLQGQLQGLCPNGRGDRSGVPSREQAGIGTEGGRPAGDTHLGEVTMLLRGKALRTGAPSETEAGGEGKVREGEVRDNPRWGDSCEGGRVGQGRAMGGCPGGRLRGS